MTTTLDQKINELSPDRREQVEKRGAALIAEELSLRKRSPTRKPRAKQRANSLRVAPKI